MHVTPLINDNKIGLPFKELMRRKLTFFQRVKKKKTKF